MFQGASGSGTFGAFHGMSATQVRAAAAALQALAFADETSDKASAVFVELLSNLNKDCGPDFKGCDWQTTDQVEIDRFLRDPLNAKPFCNRMMYGVLQGVLQLWTPENENRIPKNLPILVTCGTGDPVGGITTTVLALIERHQQY